MSLLQRSPAKPQNSSVGSWTCGSKKEAASGRPSICSIRLRLEPPRGALPGLIVNFLDHQPNGEEIPRLVECVLESPGPIEEAQLAQSDTWCTGANRI